MLSINKRSLRADTIEELKERIEKRKEKFFKNWKECINDKNIFEYDYKVLTDNILIQCNTSIINDGITDNYISKQTNIFNIKNKTVICIGGISTLNIKEIPIDINYYNI